MYSWMIALLLLHVSCLQEESVQQAKEVLQVGDVVFDATDVSKTAVKLCQDTNCHQATAIPYILHQVALHTEQEITGMLQFSDLHVSFRLEENTYTCLRRSVPLGKMTLLWRRDDGGKYCYAPDNGGGYASQGGGASQGGRASIVQQFASACVAEEDWSLVAGEGDDLKTFACRRDDVEISSTCFDEGECVIGGIDKNTNLSEVKIMAEWKLDGEVTCSAGGTGEKFADGSALVDVSNSYTAFNGTVGSFSAVFSCAHDGITMTDTYYDDGDDSHKWRPPGICVAANAEAATDTLAACTTQNQYIKITFAPKQR